MNSNSCAVVARAAWNAGSLDHMVSCCNNAMVYPVAVGLVSAAHAIPLPPTFTPRPCVKS